MLIGHPQGRVSHPPAWEGWRGAGLVGEILGQRSQSPMLRARALVQAPQGASLRELRLLCRMGPGILSLASSRAVWAAWVRTEGRKLKKPCYRLNPAGELSPEPIMRLCSWPWNRNQTLLSPSQAGTALPLTQFLLPVPQQAVTLAPGSTVMPQSGSSSGCQARCSCTQL